jgi:hypothetical protein
MGFGFAAFGQANMTNQTGYVCDLPDWLFCLLFLAMPGAWLWRWGRAKQRGSLGLCRKCGYDLRATLERCPECGTVAKKV